MDGRASLMVVVANVRNVRIRGIGNSEGVWLARSVIEVLVVGCCLLAIRIP